MGRFKVTKMSSMFCVVFALVADLSKWDIANVTGMRLMFRVSLPSSWPKQMGRLRSHTRARGLNVPLPSTLALASGTFQRPQTWARCLNVPLPSTLTLQMGRSNVIGMRLMFRGVSAFHADPSKWYASNVSDMNSIFARPSDFNADLSNWHV